MKQKRKKMPEATVYAIRTESGLWRDEHGMAVSFARCVLDETRADAKKWRKDGDTIVPCRVRVLPSAKKAPRRTR